MSLTQIDHIVVLMLENRSFDHMLGFLYAAEGNKSPAGQPFEGLTGKESNPDGSGKAVTAYQIEAGTQNAYFMPGADPGEGYSATNSQLFGKTTAPVPPVLIQFGWAQVLLLALAVAVLPVLAAALTIARRPDAAAALRAAEAA